MTRPRRNSVSSAPVRRRKGLTRTRLVILFTLAYVLAFGALFSWFYSTR